MRRVIAISTAALASMLLAGACERVKSASPLSPSLAGPIPGVNITEPHAYEPGSGAQISADQQPIRLTVDNASTNGVRPLSYIFEIATDAAFASKVFTQTGVTPGDSGRTSLVLPQPLAPERTYFWRAKADDGANGGGYMSPAQFRVFTPIVIQPPVLKSPNDGATLTTQAPTLVVTNSTHTGPVTPMSYLFEIGTDPAIANRVVQAFAEEGSAQTSYTTPTLAPSTRFYWRVKGLDNGHESNWSNVISFVTPAAAPTTPSPNPGPNPGPAANDEINLNTVTVQVGVNIANWAVTSTVTGTSWGGNTLCIFHTKAGRWPTAPFFDDPAPVEGNQWVFANIGGKWYGGAGEWLRPGQECKSVPRDIGPDTFYNSDLPLRGWIPQSGEMIGLAVSTPARVGQWTTAERSNVVLFRWP